MSETIVRKVSVERGFKGFYLGVADSKGPADYHAVVIPEDIFKEIGSPNELELRFTPSWPTYILTLDPVPEKKEDLRV